MDWQVKAALHAVCEVGPPAWEKSCRTLQTLLMSGDSEVVGMAEYALEVLDQDPAAFGDGYESEGLSVYVCTSIINSTTIYTYIYICMYILT